MKDQAPNRPMAFDELKFNHDMGGDFEITWGEDQTYGDAENCKIKWSESAVMSLDEPSNARLCADCEGRFTNGGPITFHPQTPLTQCSACAVPLPEAS